MSYTPKDVLEEAAKLFDEYGWVRGRYGDEQSGYCSFGALDTAAHELDVDYEEGESLVFAAADLLADVAEIPTSLTTETGTTRLIRWNDDEHRTADDVKALFRTAIETAELRDDEAEWDGVPGSEEDVIRNGH